MKIKCIAVLFCLLITLTSFAQNNFMGTWVGGLDNGNQWLEITIKLNKNDNLISGVLDIPANGTVNQELKNISIRANKIHFEWERSIGTGFFDGELGEGGIMGAYKRGNINSNFLLTPKITISLKVLDTYTGNYEIESGRFLSIGLFGNDNPGIRYQDSKTGRSGILYTVSQNKFIAGPTYSIPLPINFSVTFINKNRNTLAIEYVEKGKKIIAKKVALHKQQELKYKVGNAELYGVLYTPIQKVKHPAIIIVRPAYTFVKRQGELVSFFLGQGLAVLTLTEKIQDGKLQNYNNATFEERAEDIIGGLNAIKNLPEIDAKRIGLFGSSLGSWVAPIAASLSSDVSFMILQVISAQPVAENILYEIENDLREENVLSPGTFSEEEIKKAIALRKHLNYSILNNKNWDTLKNEIQISKDQNWFGYARSGWISNIILPPDEKTLKDLQASIAYDPVPVLEKTKVPVLTINAGFDNNVETNKTVPILISAFKKAGNKKATIVILPFANHGLQEIEKGINSEYYKLKNSAFGYRDIMTDWIKRNILLK